jgi:hypothetical protein
MSWRAYAPGRSVLTGLRCWLQQLIAVGAGVSPVPLSPPMVRPRGAARQVRRLDAGRCHVVPATTRQLVTRRVPGMVRTPWTTAVTAPVTVDQNSTQEGCNDLRSGGPGLRGRRQPSRRVNSRRVPRAGTMRHRHRNRGRGARSQAYPRAAAATQHPATPLYRRTAVPAHRRTGEAGPAGSWSDRRQSPGLRRLT